jgi:hypothetical protein
VVGKDNSLPGARQVGGRQRKFSGLLPRSGGAAKKNLCPEPDRWVVGKEKSLPRARVVGAS